MPTMTPPATTLVFRPAFPDETDRASFLDTTPWNHAGSHWFVAVLPRPIERLVGAIRYTVSLGVIDFRMVAGAGGELLGQHPDFLQAWMEFCNNAFAPVLVRYADLCPLDSPLESWLLGAGFESRYHEQSFETEWPEARRRVQRIHQALQRQKNPFRHARILPVRGLPPEDILRLVLSHQLMNEIELRRMWNSPDPSVLNRDLSACMFLQDKPVGALLCAELESKLHILALTGDEKVPGARRHALPMLMEHVFTRAGERSFTHLRFRANVDQARQTVNLAIRTGGQRIGEAARYARHLRPPSAAADKHPPQT
jgi:hypothetical protein